MNVVRIYTGSDGQSHFEDLDIPLAAANYGALSKKIPVTGLSFRTTPPGGLLDFHCAPRRQFVITLDGEVEVECGDGTKRRFGAGAIMLADDTTGQGHITRELGNGRKGLFVGIPEDLDVTPWRS